MPPMFRELDCAAAPARPSEAKTRDERRRIACNVRSTQVVHGARRMPRQLVGNARTGGVRTVRSVSRRSVTTHAGISERPAWQQRRSKVFSDRGEPAIECDDVVLAKLRSPARAFRHRPSGADAVILERAL